MNPHAVEDEKALDRIVFFSDAIFAPAPVVRELRAQLLHDRPALDGPPSEVRLIRRYDGVLLWINMLFLFCIAFLPFPTAVLGRNGGSASTVLYASAMAPSRGRARRGPAPRRQRREPRGQ